MPSTTFSEEYSSPQVELHHGLRLAPIEIAALTAANASTDPEQSWREALLAWRVFAIRDARAELLNATVVNDTVIRRVLDATWMTFSPAFKKATGPMIAEAYIRAFRDVEAGSVPANLIYKLADEHAERVGRYFNETSADAVSQGFQTYVNRQVPQRAAIERALDAYGLTPKQMSGYTSAQALNPLKMETAYPQNLKRKVQEYIGKSIADRLKVFKRQEAHNLGMQSKQVAWLWLVENGKLPETAQKMWLTASDEKVCTQCGPMHRKKVGVKEKFELPNGNELFVPGAHVNCRCQVRLQINPFSEVGKAERWEPKEHPRGGDPKNRGRFTRVAAKEAPSAFLENLASRAERERSEESVIETAPPKLRPQVAPPAMKPSITPQVPRLSDAPQISPAAALRPQVVPPTPEPQIKLSPQVAPITPFASAPLRPQLPQLKPKVDYEGLVRDQEERQSAQQVHEMEEVTTRPTRLITDIHGTPVTGFLIGDAGAMLRGIDAAMLSDDDRVRLLTEAERHTFTLEGIRNQFQQNVTEMHQSMMGGSSDLEVSDVHVDEYGNEETVYGLVPSEIVYETLRKTLEMSEGPAPEFDQETVYTMEWVDDTGEYAGEYELSWRDMSEMLGITADEYMPVLFGMGESYTNAYRVDDHTWSAPGIYTVTNFYKDFIEDHKTGQKYPYYRGILRPQVREGTIFSWRGIYPEDQPPS